jgi:hypothetical protein
MSDIAVLTADGQIKLPSAVARRFRPADRLLVRWPMATRCTSLLYRLSI